MLRIIIVSVRVRAIKIYVTTVEALRRKERGGDDSMKVDHEKIDGFLSFTLLMVMYFFGRFLFKVTPFVTKLGLRLLCSLLYGYL